MKKVRIGVLGLGNIGKAHVKTIVAGHCPDAEVTAVCDGHPAQLEWAKSVLPASAGFFDNAGAMLESGLIDALLVAVPHFDHPKYAMAGFSRGLHVMLEKPVGVYTKQVREVNEAADKAGVVFGVMFNQRTDHIYRKMRELVRGGELGAIRRTNWIITNWYRSQAYYNSGDWRATWAGEGGGVLLNQCPHNLDLWQWICGMPVKIDAHLHYGKWHDIEVEDDVTAYVEYGNGATGVFITSTGDYPGTNRFEVTMEGGQLVTEDNKLFLRKLSTPLERFSRENTAPFGSPDMECIEVGTDGQSVQHTGVLNSFAGAILRGEPLVADGREGIQGLTLSNAMHLSSFTGAPVTLPLDEELYYSELMKRIAKSRFVK